MRLKRAERDMFGRRAAPAPAPAKEQPASLRQQPLPPGVRPFLPVLALVVVLIAFLITPLAGAALIVVLAGAVMRMRYRQVKDVDYQTLRLRDPLYRSLDDFRHGRNRYGDQDAPSE